MMKQLRSAIRALGFDIVRCYDPDQILVPRYLCPDPHKLVDFRREAGFSEIAQEIKAHGRTFLDYNRLFVLWNAVKNICQLKGAVAEVGTYKGGSARFIASAFGHRGYFPPIHVFDTFEGHPDIIDSSIDGAHSKGGFSHTSYQEVRQYLSSFSNIQIHLGDFKETRADVAFDTFSFVHIDVDIYHSTVGCLEFFWPRMCHGSVIIVDDYGFVTCKGVKQAVDEFMSQASNYQAWHMHTGQFMIQKVFIET